MLVQHILSKHETALGPTPEALRALTGYPWRGNVRELENIMERALLLSRGEPIGIQHLPEEFQSLGEKARPLSLEEVEHQHIVRVLRMSPDLDSAAKVLGIDPTTLWRKRKKYGL